MEGKIRELVRQEQQMEMEEDKVLSQMVIDGEKSVSSNQTVEDSNKGTDAEMNGEGTRLD